MRLLFVIDSLTSGGAQRQLVALALELNRLGHAVDLFVYYKIDHFAEPLRAAGIEVICSPKPSRFSLKPAFALRRLIKSRGYDLVMSFMPTPSIYAIMARTFLRLRPPLVVSVRSGPVTGWKKWRRRMFEMWYGLASFVTFNSHHTRDYFCRQFPWMRNRVITIWNGVDLNQFTRLSELTDEPLNPLKLICVGRIEADKKWEMVIHALEILKDRNSFPVEVTHVGRLTEMSPVENAYLDCMKNEIRDLGLEDAWQWLGARTDVSQLYQSHHALVHPSVREGLSNVVCEALACGCTPIVSNAHDHPKLVEDEVTGFLFDSHDPASLANKITKFYLLKSAQRQEMRDNARHFSEEHLSIKQLGKHYEQLFQTVVAGNN